MGSSESKASRADEARRKEEWLSPIENQDQLIRRHQKVLGKNCLSRAERLWLQAAFDTFATQKGLWTEADLTFFLSLSFPEPATPLLVQAGPIIYRLMICLGSYPYVQDPVASLDLYTLSSALAILSRKDWKLSTEEDGEDKNSGRQQRYLRLVFQALTSSDSPPTNDETRSDEDLEDALLMLENNRGWRLPSNAKVQITAPSLPSASFFPSCFSARLDGGISRVDLSAFMKLLLACQLYEDGKCGPHHTVASPDDAFSLATTALLSSFEMEKGKLCEWREFDHLFNSLNLDALMGIDRVLAPLIEPFASIDLTSFRALSKEEASDLIRTVYDTPMPTVSLPGKILNLPSLAQLSMLLTEDSLVNQLHLVANFQSNAKVGLENLHKHTDNKEMAFLLLISGHTERQKTSISRNRIICGIFLPGAQISKNTPRSYMIFQCQPEMRMAHGMIDRRESTIRGDMQSLNMNFVVQNSHLCQQSLFHVNGRLNQCSFKLLEQELCFTIGELELFEVPMAEY